MAGQIQSRPGALTESADPVVIVVDDDFQVQRGLSLLLRSAGFKAVCYGSAPEFLKAVLPDTLRCLITDVRLPQIDGLELQAELARRGVRIPIIFITGHGDIPMSVQAMKAGAIDFLPKPFREQELLDAIHTALALDRAWRKSDAGHVENRVRYEALTKREREVMELVTRGLMNKQVAGELGLSEITVKLHRSRLMRKMGVRTLADLVRTSEALRSMKPPATMD